MRLHHDEELSAIERELTFLQANMLKEQKRLEAIIAEKMAALATQETEVDRLRKQNKKLLTNAQTSKLFAAMMDQDRDMDTPSSEDSSPKSSFSNKSAKIEIKPRLPLQNIDPLDLHTPTKEDHLPDSPPVLLITKRPPPPPPASTSSPATSPVSQKPPVPSRAGIDRKLQKSGMPPPPPVRSVSLLNGCVTPTKDDSGRDSDATDHEFHHLEHRARARINPDDNFVAGDEGFCSSHEDHHNNNNNVNNSRAVYDSYLESIGLNTKSVISPSRQLTNHRGVQKPSDIKFRAKLKSTAVSSLAVLEEHQVTGDGQVTTVTYWTEPYL